MMDGGQGRRLLKVAQQCLECSPSRELDGVIFCAVYDLEDLNDLSIVQFKAARATGEVLVEAHKGFAAAWLLVPNYTSDKEAARNLFPHHVDIFPDNLSIACAAALRARVAVGAPTPVVLTIIRDNMRER